MELGQQVLLEPPPRREIRAAVGTGHWGVDPSVKRVSVSGVYPGGQVVAVRSFRELREGERLAEIYEQTRLFAGELRKRWGPPGFVWVEQPFAFKHPVPPVSYMAQGVIMAAIVAATGAVVEAVKPPARWKSLSVGNGNANKALVAEWARLNGCPSSLQDDCDAWAMAVAASRAVGFCS